MFGVGARPSRWTACAGRALEAHAAGRSRGALDRMTTESSSARYGLGLHVYLYFWLSLLIVSVWPAGYIATHLFTQDQYVQGLTLLAFLVVAFQGLFWLARRRCSSASLSVWRGLLKITRAMTVGVGLMSMFVAVPCVMAAILISIGASLVSLFDGDAEKAQLRFQNLVAWFDRNRMYQ
jgi:hypothetical protein